VQVRGKSGISRTYPGLDTTLAEGTINPIPTKLAKNMAYLHCQLKFLCPDGKIIGRYSNEAGPLGAKLK